VSEKYTPPLKENRFSFAELFLFNSYITLSIILDGNTETKSLLTNNKPKPSVSSPISD